MDDLANKIVLKTPGDPRGDDGYQLCNHCGEVLVAGDTVIISEQNGFASYRHYPYGDCRKD